METTTARQLDFALHVGVIILLLLLIIFDSANAIGYIIGFQFFIGLHQLISSIIRLFRYYSFDRISKKMILLYWRLVTGYFVGMFILSITEFSRDYMLAYIFSAWAIAFYYCYITYRIAFPKYLKSHLDI